jgi:amino acid adenylation domain-containing protein
MSGIEASLDLLAWINEQRANGVELYLQAGKLKFRGPKEALTADVMTRLRASKDDIHALLSGEFIAANRYPLSYSQQAIYMLYRLVPNNPAYNTVFVAQLQQDVDFDALRSAYEAVAQRHPMFNTRFGEDENGAWQQVLPIVPQPIAQCDATQWSQQQLDQWIATESDAPFDLSSDSPFRFSLVSGHDSGNYLTVTVHHIGADLWTLLLIADELQTAYRAIRTDKPVAAQAATFTYRDHVEKQQQYLASPQGARDWQFWQQRLAGMPTILPLPLDFARSDRLTLHGARISLALDTKLVADLREFCRQQGLTPFMLVHAALQLTLFRLTQARQFVVGTPTAGRIFAGSEQVIGDFANPVVLCADFDRTPTGTTLLAWVRRQITSALEHQAFPFPELVARLQPARDLRRSPLFQVMYVWHQAHPQSQLAQQEDSHVLVTDVLPISGPRGAPYDLMLAVTDEQQRIVCNWSYNTALFRPQSVETIGAHLNALLQQLIENPQQAVEKFRLPTLALAAPVQQDVLDAETLLTRTPTQLLACTGLRWINDQGEFAAAGEQCHVLIPLNADDAGIARIDQRLIYRDGDGRSWFCPPFTLRAPLSASGTADSNPVSISYDVGFGFVRFAEGCHYSALDIIEQQVLQIAGVRAAVARGRWRPQASDTVVLYVVLDRPRLVADVGDLLRDRFGWQTGANASDDDVQRIIVQVLPRMPLDVNGNPNEFALAAIPFWSHQHSATGDNELLDITAGYDAIERLYLPDHGVASADASASADIAAESGTTLADVPLAFADGGELLIPHSAPRTLTEALLRTARESQSRLVFVDSTGTASDIGYADLLLQAKRVASGLRQQGMRRGDYALLQVQGAHNHFPVFWGCVLCGVIPVTVAVPDVYDQQNGVARKVFNVWKSLPKCTLVASDALVNGLGVLFAAENARCLPLSKLQNADAIADAEIHIPDETDVVFLQLTSGSTGTPKCIQETHRGIVAHIHGSAQFNGYDGSNVSLNWLPMDHVVPILTTHLKDCYLGTTQVQLPTAWVLQQPLRWLDMIDRYRVTHTWAPNFAFRLINLALRSDAKPATSWDLQCVQQFMNAGEQVSDAVIVEFTQLLQAYGLSPATMQPAFGMAECCTCITYRQQFDAASPNILTLEDAHTQQKPRAFVDLGAPMPGVAIRIVDAGNNLLPEGVIGRFQMKGAVVTPGYLNNSKANAESLVGNGWFNSGDLGFIRDGRLALTGREKETIIVYGANHYCYEIEEQVGELAAVRPTFVAAVGVYNAAIATDELVLFYVPKKPFSDNTALVQDAVEIAAWMATHIGLRCSYVVPIQAQDFPKTTSGKIQRLQLKSQFIAGQYRDFQRAWDLHHANDRTLPHWFYETQWINAGAATAGARGAAVLPLLVLHDDSAAAAIVIAGLRRHTAIDHCIGVNAFNASQRETIETSHASEPLRAIVIITAGATDVRVLIPALQKLYSVAQSPLRLLWLRQGVNTEDFSANALLQSMAAEQPQCSASVIDCADAAETAGEYLWQELTAANRYSAVRYQNGKRTRRAIRQQQLQKAGTDSAVKTGGVYIVTGANGGIARQLIRHLQQTYQARLILLGRTSPAEEIATNAHTAFVTADITDSNALRKAVDRARTQLAEANGVSIDTVAVNGVFHLAGTAQYAQLDVVDADSMAPQLVAKVEGTANLLALLAEQRCGQPPLMVNFSSVNGVFGGNGAGIYSLANARQIELSQAASSVRSYTLAWTQWHGTGMSQHLTAAQQQLAERSGYASISVAQGMQSLDIALRNAPGVYLIGINPRTHAAQMQLAGALPSYRPVVVTDARNASAALSALALNARYLAELDEDERARFLGGRTAVATVAQPLPPANDTRQRCLLSAALQCGEVAIESSAQFVAARNDAERSIQALWRDVLGREVSVTASFFEAGGDSLSAMQVVSRLQSHFRCALSVADLFANPSIVQLAQLIGGKVEAGVEPADESALLPVTRFEGRDDIALSASQSRIWFLQQFTGDLALWNVVIPLKITGDFAQADLQRAVNAVVDRHEIFSCRIVLGDVGPVHRRVDKRYPEIVVHQVDGDFEALNQAAKIVAEEPFDLQNDLLLRVDIFVSNSSPQKLVQLATHHIVSDGWSLANLVREMAAGFSGQLPAPLSLQYLDFVQSERQWLQSLDDAGSAMSQQVNYWLEQLRGIPSQLAFFTDQPRAAVQTWGGAEQYYEMPAQLAQQLAEFCRTQQLTPFMVLTTAYSLLLSRYCRENDVVIGTPIANRAQHALEPLIGLFMNTLAIRTRIDADDSVSALLSQVRQTTLDAYRHQQLPFEKLVELLAPQRDLGHTPIFQHMLIVQNAPLDRLQLPGMSVEALARPSSIAKFDMTMQWHQSNERWHCAIEFNTALFAPHLIDTLFRQFCHLLTQMLSEPQARVAQLNVLTATEITALRQQLSHPGCDYDRSLNLFARLQQHATATPDAIAVRCDDIALNYAALHRKVIRLGGLLQSFNVRRGDLIGVALQRNENLPAVLLAIHALGATYVPLDPDYPEGRIAYMIEHCQPRLLLTDTRSEQKNAALRANEDEPAAVSSARCNLDRYWSQLGNYCIDEPQLRCEPNQLAYVIYTSGSTGKPKGVQVYNHGLANFLFAMAEELEFARDDVLLAVTSLSFDIAALELFLPLLLGGTVVIATREQALDGSQLCGLIEQHAVTALQATPATWHLLLDAGWHNPSSSRFLALCGGEPMPVGLARQLLDGRATLFNVYGPTETTVWSTLSHIREVAGSSVDIGHAIANTQLYILDENRNPVPQGAAGELYIGGDGVTAGYLLRDDLTQAAFVSAAQLSDAGTIYKTGDLVRLGFDGKLHCLGRIDNQVKLRGFRIELAEIETVLLSFAGVAKAVALLAPDRSSLLAVVECDAAISVEQIAQHGKSFLPAYMVPSRIVIVDALPLTPNGKIDRRAVADLPQLSLHHDNAVEAVAARTPLEQQVLELWQSLVAVRGVTDNFFESGGHSLLAAQLAQRTERQFGVRFPTLSVFQAPSVADSAALIERLRNRADSLHLAGTVKGHSQLHLLQEGQGTPVLLVYAVDGSLHHYRAIIDALPQTPVYGLELVDEDLADDLPVRAAKYAALVADAFTGASDRELTLLGWSFGGVLAHAMTLPLARHGISVRRLVMLDSYVAEALPMHDRIVDEALLLAAFAVDLGVDPGFAMGLSSQPVPQAQQRLLQMLHDAGLAPDTFIVEQLQQAFTRFCANHRALQQYRPHVHDGDVTLVRATSNPLFSQAPQLLGWQSSAANVNIVDTNCDHYAVVSHATVLGALARSIRGTGPDTNKNDLQKSDRHNNKVPGSVVEET